MIDIFSYLLKCDNSTVIYSFFSSYLFFQCGFCFDLTQSRFVAKVSRRVFYHGDDIIIVQIFRIEEIDMTAFPQVACSDATGTFTICFTNALFVLFLLFFQLQLTFFFFLAAFLV